MAEGDVEFGHVVDLTLGEPSGTELVADAAIGATTLTVDYAGDFEDAGEVSLNGATLAYTSIAYGAAETDPDVITLASPLVAAALTDDKVVRVSGGEEMSDWLLHVSLGDGHPVDIPIPFEQRALWSNVDPSTPVPVMVSADLERLVEVPGRTPTVDGALVDASTLDVTTLPPVSDGDAPSAATTVTPIGGIGSMFYRWTEVDNADPVTYRLYVRAGSSPAAPTLLATNLSTNPSGEATATGWVGNSGSTAPAQTTEQSWPGASGTHSIKLARGAGTNAILGVRALDTILTGGAGTYTATVHLWIPSLITGTTGIRISGTGVTTVNSTTMTRDAWAEVSATFTWNGTGTVSLSFRDESVTAGAYAYVDGIIYTKTATPVPYFDGDTPNTPGIQYAWTGTAGASTSTMSSITLDPAYEVAAGVGLTSASVRKLADGTAIVGDGSVTYHAIVAVEDADGPGPASADVTGIPAQVTGPDIATGAVTTDLLVFNDGWGINLTGETLTGATIQTSATPDQGIHLDSNGLRAYGPAGGSPFFDVNPSKGLVIVAGEGTFDKLTTPGLLPAGETSAELGGLTQVKSGGKITLVGGALPPAKAPTVDYTYDITQFTNDSLWGDRYGWSTDGTYWYTARIVSGNLRVEKWSTAGLQASGSLSFVNAVAGCVVSGGYLYVLVNNGERVDRFDASTLAYVDTAYWSEGLLTGRNPTIGVDSTNGNLLLAQPQPSQSDHVRFRRYTWPAVNLSPLTLVGTFVDTGFAYDNDLAGVYYGAADLGANRYVFTARSGENTYRVADTTGAAVAAENWQAPARRVGFAYTGGAFVTMDYTGTMRTFTGLEKATAIGNANLTKSVSSTNYRGGTPWETPQSPRVPITINKRSKLTVTTAALPTAPGTNDPNQVQVYVGQNRSATVGTTNASPNLSGTFTAADVGSSVIGAGIPASTTIVSQTGTAAVMSKNATATAASVVVTLSPDRAGMWQQTTPAVGAITAAYTSLATSGTNPPSANNFPAATQAILEATTNGFTVDAASNGSVGTGTFRDSVDARANAMSAARMQAGTASSGTVVAATAKVVTVTFPTAFSSAPKVALTDLNSDPGVDRRTAVVPGSETTTQFQVAFWRATGTASFDANWLAVKP